VLSPKLIDNAAPVGAALRSAAATVLVASCLIGLPAELRAAESSSSLTPDQKGWAMATSAILFQRNRGEHYLLAGAPRMDGYVDSLRNLLSQWWGVRTRSELLDALEYLDTGGHRRKFAGIGAVVTRLPPEVVGWLEARVARLDPELANQVAVAQRQYTTLGGRSLLGWDYGRYVALCRWGYAVGFLTEDDAWERMMRAARILQPRFGSWSELGENYLIGREFWSLRQTEKDGELYRASYQTLLSDPHSPWKRYPWNLSLESVPR